MERIKAIVHFFSMAPMLQDRRKHKTWSLARLGYFLTGPLGSWSWIFYHNRFWVVLCGLNLHDKGLGEIDRVLALYPS